MEISFKRSSRSANWKYYNPNPAYKPSKNGKIHRWTRSDCFIRSICAATGMTWSEAYEKACASAAKVFDMPNGDKGIDQTLNDLGFVCCKMPKIEKGGKRFTVGEFAFVNPHVTMILSVANHIVCVKDGEVLDTFDSRYCAVYKYWVMK